MQDFRIFPSNLSFSITEQPGTRFIQDGGVTVCSSVISELSFITEDLSFFGSYVCVHMGDVQTISLSIVEQCEWQWIIVHIWGLWYSFMFYSSYYIQCNDRQNRIQDYHHRDPRFYYNRLYYQHCCRCCCCSLFTSNGDLGGGSIVVTARRLWCLMLLIQFMRRLGCWFSLCYDSILSLRSVQTLWASWRDHQEHSVWYCTSSCSWWYITL